MNICDDVDAAPKESCHNGAGKGDLKSGKHRALVVPMTTR